MGKIDSLTKQYLAQKDVFADAFNYYLFNGEQVIKPEDLKEQDPTEIAIIHKYGKVFPNQKMRDVLKLCTIRHSGFATLILLGIEAQANIHYWMPVRDYLYDALTYAAQVEEIRKKHEDAKDLNNPAELLSGFKRRDTLVPVITLCICFDKAKWNAPRSLYDMFGRVDPRIKQYVDDYHLNLITPGEIKDFSKFASELGIVLEVIKKSDDKKGLGDIIMSQEKYRSVDLRTVDLINAYTTTNISTKNAEGGKIDMGNAFQELQEDWRAEGRREYHEKIIDFIKKQQASGVSSDEILQEIITKPSRKTHSQLKR